MNNSTLKFFDIAARILIAVLFLYSGTGKLMDPSAVASRLASLGFPLSTVVAYLTIVFELGAALALMLGYRLLLITGLLAGFALLTALLFHQFWAVDIAQRAGQTTHFLKNLTLIGGLWFVARSVLNANISSVDSSKEVYS